MLTVKFKPCVFCLSLLVITLSVACNPIDPLSATQSALPPVTATQHPTSTMTASPTVTPTFTASPTPTLTLTPTITNTPTNTPIPYSNEPLTQDNVSDIVQLAQWGKGSVTETIWIEESQTWIVNTQSGVYLYKDHPIEEIAFYAGAQQMSVSLDHEKMALRFPENKIKVFNLTTTQVENELSFETTIPWYQQDRLNTVPKDQYDDYYQQIMGYLTRFSASAFSPDNQFLALGFGDDHIIVWDLETNLPVADLFHDVVTNVSQIAFSPDNQNLFTSHTSREKSKVGYWNIPEAKLNWHKISAGHIVGNPFSPDGSYLVLEMTYSYSKDASVLVWDTKFGDEIGRVSGRVASNPFSPDGELLVTTSYSQVKLWSIPGVYLHKKFDTGLDWPGAVFTNDGDYISVNHQQQVWHVEDLTQDPELQVEPVFPPDYIEVNNELLEKGHFSQPIDIFFLPNGQFRILGQDGINVYWWDVPSSSVIYKTIRSWGTESIFSPDGTVLFYCSEEKLFRLETRTMESQEIARCDKESILAYSLELDVIARGDRTILDFIQASSGEIIHTMQGHRKFISAMEFSNDGGLFASGSREFQGFGEIILWDTNPTIKLMYEGNRPNGVEEIAFSSNKTWMATSSGGFVQIWSILEQRLFTNMTIFGTSLAFSPDEKLLAVGSYDGSIHFFQVPSGDKLTVLQGHSGRIMDMIFTADGSNLLSIANDGVIRLWGMR